MSEWVLSTTALATVTSFPEAVATALAAVATGSAIFFFRTAKEFLVTWANSMSASCDDESLMFLLICLINKHLNLHIFCFCGVIQYSKKYLYHSD
jgi:hypothetical protein